LLEELVKRAAEELRLRERAIDEVMGRARRARILSKQAILQIHGDAIEEAEERLHEAGRNLREMDEYVRERPGLGRFDQVGAAREEFAEASILLGLKGSGKFPNPEAVGVPLEAYLRGLGDVPGELRRQALDALRVGDLGRAESLLETMEEIYLSLVSMEETPFLKGLRRKLDIARGVIERTRSEITAEVGRRRLDESVRRLTEKLE
jgi:translin